MRWTCPKCGKKLEVSNEQLIANDGVIVCPQCLLQARQPVPKTRVSTRRDDEPTTPPKRSQQSISFETDTPPEYHPSTTPPPHKTRMKQASTSYRYTGLSGNGNNTSTPTRKSTGKKKSKKKKKQSDGMSALGCMGRTIIFTLVLFAAYVFFGLLLDALQ